MRKSKETANNVNNSSVKANGGAVKTPNEQMVIVKNAKAVTTSRKIAETFGKNHKDVLRDIENLSCSIDFTERNFALSSYKDKSGKSNKEFQLTKDGAVMLIMGYIGKRAMEFKEAYINAFNAMEQKLHTEILPMETEGLFKGLVPIIIKGVKWVCYTDFLRLNGLSTSSGAVTQRKIQHPIGFIKIFGRSFINEQMAKIVLANKELRLMWQQLVIDFEKGGNNA